VLFGVAVVRHQVTKLFASKELVSLREHVRGRQKILTRRYQWFAVPWSDQVVLNAHQQERFSSRFFRLRQVHVHFISIEIRIVRRTNTRVEAKRFPLHNFNAVRHDGNFVQRGLSIEEDNVAILHVPFDDVADAQTLCCPFAVTKGQRLDERAVLHANEIGAWVHVGPVAHALSQLFQRDPGHGLGIRHGHGDF